MSDCLHHRAVKLAADEVDFEVDAACEAVRAELKGTTSTPRAALDADEVEHVLDVARERLLEKIRRGRPLTDAMERAASEACAVFEAALSERAKKPIRAEVVELVDDAVARQFEAVQEKLAEAAKSADGSWWCPDCGAVYLGAWVRPDGALAVRALHGLGSSLSDVDQRPRAHERAKPTKKRRSA